MATKKKRYSVMVTDDIANSIEKLKKEQYYNKSYSELYRQLFIAGIDRLQAK